MSKHELARLRLVQDVQSKQATLSEAASRLGISTRQMKRLVRAYRTGGPAGLISRRRGRPSNNKTSPELLAAAVERVAQSYRDFGPTLACEKLAAEGIPIKRERLRQAMIEAGLWQPNRKKRRRVHPPRERRAQRGELVQGDGSPHAWFEKRGPRCSLLLFVDDATSTIGAAFFAPYESTEAYFELIDRYLKRYGKPCALYVDKLSVFKTSRIGDGNDITQFARAMKELDIEVICANSPQAKGRIERANRTLQDRLVKELRLNDICDIASANEFLGNFIYDYNERFAVAPQSDEDAHRPLLPTDDLQRILAHTEERIVTKNLTIKFNGNLYQLNAPGYERRLQLQHVLVRQLPAGLHIEFRGQTIDYRLIPRVTRPIAGTKDLNAHLDQARPGTWSTNSKMARTPAQNHPWKTLPRRPSPPS